MLLRMQIVPERGTGMCYATCLNCGMLGVGFHRYQNQNFPFQVPRDKNRIKLSIKLPNYSCKIHFLDHNDRIFSFSLIKIPFSLNFYSNKLKFLDHFGLLYLSFWNGSVPCSGTFVLVRNSLG